MTFSLADSEPGNRAISQAARSERLKPSFTRRLYFLWERQQWSVAALDFAQDRRDWLALDRDSFYDEARIAIMPIGLCYPGRNARGGDLPPRRECAPRWHARLRNFFPEIELSLLVGSYAIDYYLPDQRRRSMTETVAAWRAFLPEFFVLPHPSWRTVGWLRGNPWFEEQALPELRSRVRRVLDPYP